MGARHHANNQQKENAAYVANGVAHGHLTKPIVYQSVINYYKTYPSNTLSKDPRNPGEKQQKKKQVLLHLLGPQKPFATPIKRKKKKGEGEPNCVTRSHWNGSYLVTCLYIY